MTKARDIASAIPAPSTVSSTELGYLDGVTSAIQTQIDSKIGSASAINPTIVDAKGDIIAATAADTVAKLTVGANGTVLTAASGQATGLEWATPAGGGKVLQVVQGTTSTGTNVASTTFTDTTLSASITPSLATSKVLVMVSQYCAFDRDEADQGMAIKLLRGSTDIYVPAGTSDPRRLFFASLSALGAPKGLGVRTIISFSYLDSPSTTSSTTYKTQQAVHTTANSGTAETQRGSGTSTILLLEIGA